MGYVVGGGELKPDPGKVESIRSYTYPKTVKQVRSFMGAVGWYRRFISNFATISTPIFQTLKKNKTFSFTKEAENAFEFLKEALITSPVSDIGTGAVLFQRNDLDEEHPIAYFSHKLTSAQKNNSVTERQCLAVVLAVKKVRPFIE